MRIELRWYSQEPYIIQVVFRAGWDWEDFQRFQAEAKKMAQSVPNHWVHCLMEYEAGASLLPTNALRNLGRALEKAEANAGLVIIVAPSQMWQIIIAMLKRLSSNPLLKNNYIVRTREEGLAIIHTTTIQEQGSN